MGRPQDYPSEWWPVLAFRVAHFSQYRKIMPINNSCGHLIDLDDGTKALMTVHPCYLLRFPDADDARSVDDLKIAAAQLRKLARAT
jgi:uracil-DNA glycosylase